MRCGIYVRTYQRTPPPTHPHTFSSRALWWSKRLFKAFSTSTSDDTPELAACLFTTVIRRDFSCRDTRHSRCSTKSYRGARRGRGREGEGQGGEVGSAYICTCLED